MAGLRYVRAKWGRLRCGGLDTAEGQVKTVDFFDKSISGVKGDLVFQNACCKEHMSILCVSETEYTFPVLFSLVVVTLYAG
jgi:hypothetical protein